MAKKIPTELDRFGEMHRNEAPQWFTVLDVVRDLYPDLSDKEQKSLVRFFRGGLGRLYQFRTRIEFCFRVYGIRVYDQRKIGDALEYYIEFPQDNHPVCVLKPKFAVSLGVEGEK